MASTRLAIHSIHSKGLLIMQLAIRIFALSLFLIGAGAATVSSHSRSIPTHQAVGGGIPTPDSLPVPTCGPNMPTCPPQ